MKRLLVMSFLLLFLCSMGVVRCALQPFERGSRDGMSQADIEESIELRDQGDHADQLCLLSKDIRDIIDGYATGPHLFPRIKLENWKHWELVEGFGQQGIKIPGKEVIIFFLSSYINLRKIAFLSGDSTGVFGVTAEHNDRRIDYTIFQETRANGKESKSLLCFTSHPPFEFLNAAAAVGIAVTETGAGKNFTLFTSGEDDDVPYNVPAFDERGKSALLERKIGVVGLLKPGYVESLAAVAFLVKNERKAKKRKREAGNPSLLFDH